MDRLLDLLIDTDGLAGLAVTTVAIALAALGLRLLLVPLARRRHRDDRYRRYWAGKLVSYAIATVAVISLIALWAPFGGRISVILGFATAGIAFAMQEVIGALFGWVNILAGRIYTVGDRIEVGGVRGDVMDISPLRTKVLEIGSEPTGDGSGTTWVTARQPTGRIVTVSNRKTFTEPVFNYSAHLEWIWEELAFAAPKTPTGRPPRRSCSRRSADMLPSSGPAARLRWRSSASATCSHLPRCSRTAIYPSRRG